MGVCGWWRGRRANNPSTSGGPCKSSPFSFYTRLSCPFSFSAKLSCQFSIGSASPSSSRFKFLNLRSGLTMIYSAYTWGTKISTYNLVHYLSEGKMQQHSFSTVEHIFEKENLKCNILPTSADSNKILIKEG